MADDTGIVAKDEVDIELEKARAQAKRERQTTIGTLLDKAADVLTDVLDSTDPALAGQRMRAAEVAINLYIQQDNGERQERALALQQRRLELEEEKLRLPGGPLFQQNNLYVQGQQPPAQVPPGQPTEQDALLARKQAQDALLASFLPPKLEEKVEVEIEPQEITANEDKSDVLNTEGTDTSSGDKPE